MEISEGAAKMVSSLPENVLHDGNCVSIECQNGKESCKVQLRIHSDDISLKSVDDAIKVFCVHKGPRQESNGWDFMIKLCDKLFDLAPCAAMIWLAYLAKAAIVEIMAK